MVRRFPFSTVSLSNLDCTVNFVRETSWGDRVADIATVPLTKDEYCKEFCRVELLIFDKDLLYYELYDCGEVERDRRGFCSRAIPKDMQTSVSTMSICDQIFGTG